MKTLRTAVIGAGRLGGFHAQKLFKMEGVEVVAVVDPVAANRERVAKECGAEALGNCESLLGKIDAAVIASPTVLHHQLACDLLEAGTHLLVEKPLCATVAEADELVDLARQKQLVLQVGHVERFNPALVAAAPHAQSPRFIEAVRSSNFTFRSVDIGVVLDLMIHDIDIVLSLVRSPLKRAEAFGISLFGRHEDFAEARLEFESGCIAHLTASRVAHEAVRKMQVWASRAYASIDFGARTSTVVQPSDKLLRGDLDAEQLTPAETEYYRTHLADELLPRREESFAAVDALSLELQDFVESIRTLRQPTVSGENGRDALAVAEQILARIAARGTQPATTSAPAKANFPRIVPAPHFDLSALERKAG